MQLPGAPLGLTSTLPVCLAMFAHIQTPALLALCPLSTSVIPLSIGGTGESGGGQWGADEKGFGFRIRALSIHSPILPLILGNGFPSLGNK